MTAKDWALPDSPNRWRVPMLFVAGNKPPAIAGTTPLKNMAEQQAGYGEQKDGVFFQKNAPWQKQSHSA
jgi:hypothetical protein